MSEYIDVTNYGGETSPETAAEPAEKTAECAAEEASSEETAAAEGAPAAEGTEAEASGETFSESADEAPEKTDNADNTAAEAERLPVRQTNLLRRMQVNRTKRKSRPEMKPKRTIRNRSWIIFLFTATKFWRALRRPEMS
jgi:hypothetical protein